MNRAWVRRSVKLTDVRAGTNIFVYVSSSTNKGDKSYDWAEIVVSKTTGGVDIGTLSESARYGNGAVTVNFHKGAKHNVGLDGKIRYIEVKKATSEPDMGINDRADRGGTPLTATP